MNYRERADARAARENLIAWVIGLVLLAAVVLGVAVNEANPAEGPVRAPSGRVLTDSEKSAIIEYNDDAPVYVDEGETWIPGG